MKDLYKRKGIVRVNKKHYDLMSFDKLALLFANFIPEAVVDYKYRSGVVVKIFTGFSPFFRVVKKNEKLPEYVFITTEKNGVVGLDCVLDVKVYREIEASRKKVSV